MEIEKFVKEFAAQIEDFDGELALETRFKEMKEWDSMNALAVIAMVDRKYGKQISGNEIERAETIADLFAIINKL